LEWKKGFGKISNQWRRDRGKTWYAVKEGGIGRSFKLIKLREEDGWRGEEGRCGACEMEALRRRGEPCNNRKT